MSVTDDGDRCRAGGASERVREAAGRRPTRAVAVEG